MSEGPLDVPDDAAERFRRADALFDAALDFAPPDRAPFVDAACAHDPDLRADVQKLLRAHEASASFFDAPAVAYAAPLLHAAAPARARDGDNKRPLEPARGRSFHIQPFDKIGCQTYT